MDDLTARARCVIDTNRYLVLATADASGDPRSVYLQGSVDMLGGDDLARGLQIFPGPPERGGRQLTPEEVLPPGPYRLYRLAVARAWVQCHALSR